MIIHKYQFHCHLLPFALNLNVTSKWVELWCCVLRSLLYTAKQRFHVLLKHSLLYCLHRVHAKVEQTVTKRSQHIIIWRLWGSTSIWSCIQNIYLTLSNEETQGYEAVTQISVYYIRCVGRLAPAATCSYTLWSHFTLVTLEWWRGRQGSAGALASFRLIFPSSPTSTIRWFPLKHFQVFISPPLNCNGEVPVWRAAKGVLSSWKEDTKIQMVLMDDWRDQVSINSRECDLGTLTQSVFSLDRVKDAFVFVVSAFSKLASSIHD